MERLTIAGAPFVAAKIAGADVAGRLLFVELDTPPDRGPALHVHPAQNELFYVLAGSIGLQCGKDRHVLSAGDCFQAPMGVPHAYVTLGTTTARLLNLFDPAGEMELFFRDYAHVLNAPGPPDEKRVNEISEQYGIHVVGAPLRASEFAASGN